jgi:hypothetical protein
MSPRSVKTAKRAIFLVRHWKLLLVIAAILGPPLGYSYYTCSQQPEGCTVVTVVTGVMRILAKPFT